MHPEFKKSIKARILLMNISAALLITQIMALVFGFLGTVIYFEYSLKTMPSAIEIFGDQARRLRESLAVAEKHVKALQDNGALKPAMKAIGFKNNILTLNESLKATGGRLDELSKAVYENQDKLVDTFQNEKRILFVLSGVFVAYLVKLFSGLYKYNAYVKAHYLAVLDALELTANGSEENIDIERFKRLLAALSVKDLRIDQGGTLLDGINLTKAKADT